MALTINVTGLDTLLGNEAGYSGDMTVTIAGGASAAPCVIKVAVKNAPSREAAVSRALEAADKFGKSVRFQVLVERALLEGKSPPVAPAQE